MSSLAKMYPQGVAVCWTGTPGYNTQEMLNLRIEKLLPRIEQILGDKARVIREKRIPQKPGNNERFEYRLAFQPNGVMLTEELQNELRRRVLDEFQMVFNESPAVKNLNEF